MDSEEYLDFMKSVRQKLSSDDSVGSIVQNSLKLFQAFISDEAVLEKVRVHSKSLELNCNRIQQRDNNRAVAQRDMVYRLAGSIESVMEWISKRGQNRLRFSVAKKKSKSEQLNEEIGSGLFNESGEENCLNGNPNSQDTNSKPENQDKYWNKFECNVCHKRFPLKSKLVRHSSIHWAPNKKEFQCEICGKHLKTLDTLHGHIRNIHSQIDDENVRLPFKCDKCNKRFPILAKLIRHGSVHLPKNKKEFDCDLCPKQFKTNEILQAHLKNMHEKDKDTRLCHKCDECEKKFSSVHNLERHKRVHLPEDDPRRKKERVICEVCGKSLSEKCELTRHMKQHLDDNDPVQAKLKWPVSCKICGKDFRYTTYLKHHMRTHSDDEAIRKPYACDICGMRFSQSGERSVHNRMHLSDDDPRKNETKCNVCGKHFLTKTILKRHIKLHSNDETVRCPHLCDICGRRFSEPVSLVVHKRAHLANEDQQVKLLECLICGRTFNKMLNLQRHMKSLHPESYIPSAKTKSEQGKARKEDPNESDVEEEEDSAADIDEESFGSDAEYEDGAPSSKNFPN